MTCDLKSIHKDMLALSVEIGHHESDLHVPVTSATKKVLNSYRAQGKHVCTSLFISNIDKKPWYDIAFAYEPNLEK